MLGKLIKYNLEQSSVILRRFSHINESSLVKNDWKYSHNSQVEPKHHMPSDTNGSVLEPSNDDVSYISSYLKPTFNFAAYINKSETLQELLKLGVDLHKIEKNVECVPFILSVKFEDIREHIVFFKTLGLETEIIGEIISKNPLILKEDLENLKIRVNYLKYKQFTDDMILRIIGKNANWLTHSTQEIDERLGFFQKQFQLTGDEVRLIATKLPSLITYSTDKVKLNIFVLKEEMGFTQEEIKQIILSKPIIFRKGQNKLLKTFEYLHRTMKIPLDRILQSPEVLTCRQSRLMERHMFLVKLRRAQYDPKLSNYVALTTLVSGSDSDFSTEIAKSSIQAYNEFLKSL